MSLTPHHTLGLKVRWVALEIQTYLLTILCYSLRSIYLLYSISIVE